jgi:hypothetical protein
VTEKTRIVVTGLIGSLPLAGLTLHYLQYVLGLRALGHDVLYLEDTGMWYYDADKNEMIDDVTVPIGYLSRVMSSFDLERWTFVALSGETFGVAGRELTSYLSSADLFLHVTGSGLVRDEYRSAKRLAYVDTDPGFVQMRAAEGSARDLGHLDRHDVHFTFAGNIGKPESLIPTLDYNWYPTRQPVFLPLWPALPPPGPNAAFTTVLVWSPYKPTRYRGEYFAGKDVEFPHFVSLPELTNAKLELAMGGGSPVPEPELRRVGWRTRRGLDVSRSIDGYRTYIQESRGEWTIAKNGYVKTRGGWFGDRSTTYLASGRPVVLQATGFEDWLPTGKGLFAFSTTEEAAAAIDDVNADYDSHCRAAREVAEEFFDSDKVLTRLLETALT